MLEKNLVFDKRIIDRNLKRGSLTKKQLAEHMKTLEDSEEKADEVVVGVAEGEFQVEFPDLDVEEDEEKDQEE
jgi:hypothetical protein